MKTRMIFILHVLFYVTLCNCSQPKMESRVGIYTSHMPRIGPLIKFYENKHKGKMVPMSVYMVYLRSDGSFVMGGCDLQIREAGKYSFVRDSISLYDIYNFKQQQWLPNKKFFFNKKTNSIYYRHPNPDINTSTDYPISIAILELGFLRSHRGFLRNQEIALDSLVKFNKFLPLDSQYVWIDKKLGR